VTLALKSLAAQRGRMQSWEEATCHFGRRYPLRLLTSAANWAYESWESLPMPFLLAAGRCFPC